MLELFVPVARLDEKIVENDELQARAHRKLDKAVQAIADAQAAIDEAKAKLAQTKEQERTHQREMARAESMRDSANRAIDAGLGDAGANERQVARCAEIIDTEETALLELMDVHEADEASLAAAIQSHADKVAAQATLRADLEPKIAAWQEVGVRLASDRSAALGVVPRDVHAQYTYTFQRRGAALSRIVGDACKRCARVVPLARLTDIRQNRLVTCDGCSLWLWLDVPPNEETAAP